MVMNMRSIKMLVEDEIVIDASRFIGILQPVNKIEDCQDALEKARKQYPLATHYCYAYILGDSGEMQKASDDGEPQKTAGIPMLEVLKKNDLTNCIAITVRYFGGKLLGASGLVRAYTKSISSLISNVTFTYKERYLHLEIDIDYKTHHQIASWIQEHAQDSNLSFTTDVHIDMMIKELDFDELYHLIEEKSHQVPTLQIIDKIEKYE